MAVVVIMEQEAVLERGIWLFARPLSHAQGIPALVSTSDGRFHFCHWGVLITELSIPDLNALLYRSRVGIGVEDDGLGVLYQLERTSGAAYAVTRSETFTASSVRTSWPNFSAKYIGGTGMLDDEISAEGIYYRYSCRGL